MREICKVCHMTSAHRQLDDRIYIKECRSLASAGYKTYIVAIGEKNDISNVEIIGCGYSNNRFERMTSFSKNVYLKAKELACDVYHIHDPELLPYGVKLKKAGKKVIFDSHEDVPAQIMDKEWLPRSLRFVISKLYKMYETYAVGKFDAVVAATPHIAEQFQGRCQKVVTVNNYPCLDDIKFHEKSFAERESIICYAGGISEMRGERIMTEAMQEVDGLLILAGDSENVSPPPRTKYVGRISRQEVNELYGRSRAGFVIYQPAKNHFEAQPIKLFEFMAAGLPMVASDFPLWKKIVEENNCGICVNPTDVDAVRKACIELLNNPERSQQLGRNGRKAVLEKYNWANEEKKLLALYNFL
ncbi:glycosyltransferase family 4 protein [Selenomonas caprae]|uniref:Glycosyltransferase family 4 protein n=1 Tax=Selenomonas caprae TaxID=2606905 RepID=A0A5D6WS17_9FIRM|nr:glycosyltransferase family 4 protein [Selenomonas caprae]TYZ29114.1 glycosyltransferase family 4 protein [Selenomonas caprae]